MAVTPAQSAISVSEISPATIRFIKLGEANGWAGAALAAGELWFGYRLIPYARCRAGDWGRVKELVKLHYPNSKNAMREIRDFYTLGADCLWVTVSTGKLWWGIAEPEVCCMEGDQAPRRRRIIGGWRDSDIRGQTLQVTKLSSRFQSAGYRGTICAVKAADYLLRKINAQEDPLTARARALEEEMRSVACQMVQGLDWRNFETLVDLIFSRGGWQRQSELGGIQADLDMALQNPITGESAFVQVKSKADQAVLDQSIKIYQATGLHDRMFFIMHSPRGTLTAGPDPRIQIWDGTRVAERAVAAGLMGWLIDRSA